MRAHSLIFTGVLWFTLPECGVSAKPVDQVEGEVIVTFNASVETERARAILDKHSLDLTEHYDRISRQRQRVTGLVRKRSQSTATLIAQLQNDPGVATVEPNYLRHVSAIPPNDPDYSKLWGLENTGQTVNSTSGTSGADCRFIQAWRLARPSPGEVVVGVIDTGVYVGHPDLAPNIWVNGGEVAGNLIDDDGNGYVDDVNGFDFVKNTPIISDSGTHGTHVAGTIAAVGKNSIGGIGVAYKTKILPLTVSADGDSISLSAVLSAYNYAVTLKQRGVNIVALNASFGGTSSSSTELSAIQSLNSVGIILCAAAGNASADNDSQSNFPADYPTANIISVAALNQNNGLAGFSNYGAFSVDIAAPGTDIYSTIPAGSSTLTSRVTVAATIYNSQEVTFSGRTSSSGVSKMIYSCGIGNPGDFPIGVSGNIALIQRGTLLFSAKVTNAMNAGAVAAIIYDNTTDSLATGSWTLGGGGNWIPTLRITKTDGMALLANLSIPGTVHNYQDLSPSYQYLSGTSMATPHVTGAVAFAAMNFPTEPLAQRVARILSNVTSVAALAGKMTSGGRLDLLKIVDTDADGLPDWWESEKFGNLARSAELDSDVDGYSNFDEFLAGTNPANATSHLSFSSFATTIGSAKHFALSFPSVADRVYRIQWSDSLTDNSWSMLGSPFVGSGSTIQFVDPSAMESQPKRFYRLSLSEE
jgi:subtilisin family serine protease